MRLSKAGISVAAVSVAAAAAIAGCGGSSGGEAAAESQSKPMAAMQKESGTSESKASAEGSTASVSPATVKLVVKSDEEHAKKGPEGKWHDAYLPANFTVKAGQKVTVHVYNYDEGKHSFTSPTLGVNEVIAAGSESKPQVTTFTFTAPSQAGEYEWFCDMPCDEWAMEHKGFMRGDVTVS